MRRAALWGTLVVGVWTLAIGRVSYAAPILDQSYNASPNAFGFIGGNNSFDWSQTFTVGISGTLAQIDLLNFERAELTTDALLFDIRTTSGSIPTEPDSGGNILASLSIPANSVPDTLGAFSVDVSSFNVSVAIGDMLAIALRSDSPEPAAYVWGGTQPVDGYAGGATFVRTVGTGGSWAASTFLLDHTFQTFVEPATVPEPSTLALMAIGLAGVGVAGRRKLGAG